MGGPPGETWPSAPRGSHTCAPDSIRSHLSSTLALFASSDGNGVGKSGLLWCNCCQDTWSSGSRSPHGRSTTMHSPAWAMSGLTVFRPVFSTPTYHRFLILVLAALLTTGRRTVTHLRRTVQSQGHGHGSSDPRVWPQRRWSTWALARAVITDLLDYVVPPGPGLLAGEDTVTEPPGPQVFGKGRHRDGGRSSHHYTAYRWGHTWGVVSGLITWPFATRPWALPVLVALVPPAGVGSRARQAPEDARTSRPTVAGAPDPLVSASTLHVDGRYGLRPQRDCPGLPSTSPAPHRGPHVFWRCGLVRAAATAHAPHHRTPARERPATGVPASGRGAHSAAHAPHGGLGGGQYPSHRGRHGYGALVPYGGSARGRPLGRRP
jgi:DDE superfamily endonuclease